MTMDAKNFTVTHGMLNKIAKKIGIVRIPIFKIPLMHYVDHFDNSRKMETCKNI